MNLMKIFERATSNKGQTLIEYGLLLVLIAVVVIVAIKLVGGSTNNLYSQVNSEVVRVSP